MPSSWALDAAERWIVIRLAERRYGLINDLAKIIDEEHERGCPYHPAPTYSVSSSNTSVTTQTQDILISKDIGNAK